MRLSAKSGTQVIDTEVSSCVISDDFGNPLVVIVKAAPHTHIIVKADEPDFNSVLEHYGLTRRVLVTDVTGNPLNDVKWSR